MKKSLPLLLAFILVSMFSYGQYTLTINDVEFSNGEITGYLNTTEKNIIIPQKFNNESVTSIGNYAFYSDDLTGVIIPATVTDIGELAFSRNQLTNIVIPDGVVTIEKNAFDINNLVSVEIQNSVTYIGFGAFNNNQLASADIPNSVTYIGNYAFANNELASIVIPSSVTYIGEHSFWNNKLNSFVLPEAQKEGFIFENWSYYYFGTKEALANTTVSNLEVAYTANFTEIPLSINSSIDSNLSTYPNPVTDLLFVKNTNNQKITVSVVDVNGSVLLSKTSRESLIEINLRDQNSGVLFVQINNGKEVIAEKIVKQ